MVFFKLLRVKQWIKNAFVLAPLLFSLNLFNLPRLYHSLFAFLAFCFASSAVYIFNDLLDKEKDRHHPVKKDRPIPRGDIGTGTAVIILVLLLIGSGVISVLINIPTLIVIMTYVVLNTLYSLFLKNMVILDAMIISLGFVLRVVAGGVAIEVVLTNWILLATLFISLFIGFGKRRHELLLMNSHSGEHRPVLEKYNVQLLDYMMLISVTLTIITYSLYTLDEGVVAKFGTNKLIYTVPFVIYGLFRYLYLIYKRESGADPSDVVLGDKSIIINVIIWGAMIVAILYLENRL